MSVISAALKSRVRRPSLFNKVMNAKDTIQFFKDGQYVSLTLHISRKTYLQYSYWSYSLQVHWVVWFHGCRLPKDDSHSSCWSCWSQQFARENEI
jgi:hypothetical protein